MKLNEFSLFKKSIVIIFTILTILTALSYIRYLDGQNLQIEVLSLIPQLPRDNREILLTLLSMGWVLSICILGVLERKRFKDICVVILIFVSPIIYLESQLIYHYVKINYDLGGINTVYITKNINPDLINARLISCNDKFCKYMGNHLVHYSGTLYYINGTKLPGTVWGNIENNSIILSF
ncbi:MAG: hypothetical protein K2P99_04745 [Burkholderiales bacterium]|nr:hypothetical protein [Burkholderiales bacterium]